jgi:succinyl-diaminopimelate desuccinylase
MSAVEGGSLLEHPALAEPFLTDVLRSLVRTPSVNPDIPESAVATVVEKWLAPLDIDVRRVEFAPGRASVGARLGAGDGPALVLNGHLDTVPIDDRSLWTTDPFGGEVRNGYLYGRGACDMKAGLAVAIGVARALADRGSSLAGSLVLHFAAGEERGEPGTLSLLEAGFTGDYGITLEPTELKVASATRGAAFIEICVKGRSIHASRAKFGVNPIALLEPVLGIIDAYDRELAGRPHPLLSGSTCTPTVVAGGVKENAVPDNVVLRLDQRLLPHEDAVEELEELRRRLEGLRAQRPEFSFEIKHMFPPLDGAEIPADSFLVTRVVDAAERVIGVRPEVYGSPFGSDVRNLVRDAGMEALTFGPGNVIETHCADERVELRQLRDAAAVVATVAEELLLPREPRAG